MMDTLLISCKRSRYNLDLNTDVMDLLMISISSEIESSPVAAEPDIKSKLPYSQEIQ